MHSTAETEISLKKITLASAFEDVWVFPGIQSRKAQGNVAIKALTIHKKHVSEEKKATKTWRHQI